ncbi:MAG: OmpA family protein [Balneolaceae bacterium]
MNDKISNTERKSLLPKQPYEETDDNGWQVSYLDIITILLGFFVVLLSISQITDTELRSVSNLFKTSVTESEFITTPIEEIKDELEIILQDELERGEIEIVRDLNDIQITFSSDDLYRSGSATIQPGAEKILNSTLEAIKEIKYTDFKIDVQGHTDDTPISSSVFPSNWELSTTRASNVVKYFNEMGVDKSRLKASGYADSQPVAPNRDPFGDPIPENMDLNRRVVVNLYYTSAKVKEDEQLSESETPQTTEPETNTTNTALPSETIENSTANATGEQITDAFNANNITNTRESTAIDNDTPEDTQSEEERIINDLLLPKKEEAPPVEEEEETAPVTEPIPVPEPRSNEPAFVPEIENMATSCSYAVQIGGYEDLANSVDVAEEAKSRTGYSFEVNFSNDLFSVRTNLETSFKRSLEIHSDISNAFRNLDVALIQHCSENGNASNSGFQYQIQFGAFQDRNNALNYALRLFDQYNIQAYMNRASERYNVVAGPYQDRTIANEQLRTFKNNGIQEDIFVKLVPESAVRYKVDFQLQLASFTNEDEAKQFSANIFRQISLKTIVRKLDNNNFYLVTESLESWNQTLSLFRELSNSRLNLDPVIYLKEGA